MTDFILQNSAPDASTKNFMNKVDKSSWLRIPDSQNGNYSSNEIILNNLALASHSEFQDCKTSYIQGAWTQSIESSAVDFKIESSVNMLSTIKACSAGVINNVMIKIGGTSVIGWQENCTIPLYIDMCSSMTPLSEDQADMQLFARDNNMSINYHHAANNNKVGLNNARPNDVTRATTGGLIACAPGNDGLMTKLNMISSTADEFVTENGLTTSVRAFIKRVSNRQIAIYYRLYIPLTSIHDVFNRIPLTKSTQISMNLLVNQSTTTFNMIAGAVNNINVTTTSSGINIQHLNLQAIAGMLAAAGATVITCQSNVTARGTVPPNPLGTNWEYVARLYEFADPYSGQLLQNPKRKITYEQSEYHLLQGIASNANYTSNITNSVSRPTRLILGFTQAQELGLTDEIGDLTYTDVGENQPSAVSNEASPFSAMPYQTIPGSATITDFQVFVGGDPVFKQGTISDTRELYEMFLRKQTNEGGYDPQTVSGITYKEFCNGFGWIVVDLTENNSTLTAKWTQNRDVTIKFRSNHRSKLQCHAFIMSESDFTLDVSSGKLIN